MGGTNCPETPRQRMISMMYLVLTALLALNVSKDILDAFVIVNDGLTKTTENFSEKNHAIYDEFKKQAEMNPEKVKEWKEKAEQVQEEANIMYGALQEAKIEILTVAGEDEAMTPGDDGEIKINGILINKKDNTDVPAQVMVTEGGGTKCKEAMVHYRDFLIKMVKDNSAEGTQESLIHGLEEMLHTEDHSDDQGEVHSWESYHFEHLPMMAVITIISKMQGDVRNAEADVITFLLGKISGEDIPFNKVDAIVKTTSTDIIQGGDYNAEIFIAAYDSTAEPEVYIGKFDSVTYKLEGEEGTDWWRLDSIQNGKGYYKVSGAGVGIHEYKGFIKIKTQKKGDMHFPFSAGYRIVPPSATVSATQMNVFYIGVPNPVKVSVPGVPADKVSASGSNVTLQGRGNGEYNAFVRGGRECWVSVSAEVNGKQQSMGRELFRIKRIPDPVPGISGKKNGQRIAKSMLGAGAVVYARKADGFEFDANFRVQRFKVKIDDKGVTRTESTNGNRISGSQAGLIKKVRVGGVVVFEDIIAVGPDGEPRNLGAMVLTLQ